MDRLLSSQKKPIFVERVRIQWGTGFGPRRLDFPRRSERTIPQTNMGLGRTLSTDRVYRVSGFSHPESPRLRDSN